MVDGTFNLSAITLHNIPEGLAVGVSFGGAASGLETASFGGAVALAIGIGLQNLPEGIAVAVPLRAEGMSRFKAFVIGQASAVVEPIGAVIGAAVIVVAAPVLPFALSFAAGAMVYVVVEELIPETQQQGNEDMATLLLRISPAIRFAAGEKLPKSKLFPNSSFAAGEDRGGSFTRLASRVAICPDRSRFGRSLLLPG